MADGSGNGAAEEHGEAPPREVAAAAVFPGDDNSGSKQQTAFTFPSKYMISIIGNEESAASGRIRPYDTIPLDTT